MAIGPFADSAPEIAIVEDVSDVLPKRIPVTPESKLNPLRENDEKFALLDSTVTVPVVLKFEVPNEFIRSPRIAMFEDDVPELVAPKLDVRAALLVTTPTVPPSIVMFPLLATMSAPAR